MACEEKKSHCGFSNVNEPQTDQEKVESAKCLGKFYRGISIIQMSLAALTLASGGVSLGLGIATKVWPFINVFPVVSGCVLLVAGYFAYKAGQADLSNAVPPEFFKYMNYNYYMCISNLSNVSLACTFSGQALGKCATDHEDCSPHKDAQMAFLIINIVLAVCAWPTLMATMVTYCKPHARNLRRCSKK